MADEFWMGGLSATLAITVCNPFDVAKTRLQLQGELAKQGASSRSSPYRGVLHCMGTIAQHEGVLALQRGIGPGAAFQFTLTSIRFGFYRMAKEYVSLAPETQPAHQLFFKSLGLAASCSCIGAVASSPFWMIKSRLQAQSSAVTLQGIGYQHSYSGFGDALSKIFKSEGFRGFFWNVEANVIRLMVSGSVQLASYDTAKQVLLRSDIAPALGLYDGSIALHIAASVITGAAVVAAWQPFDTAACRVMNQNRNEQGKGATYRGYFDCFGKTFRTEGLRGLYKGWDAQYMRIAPYTVLTFVIFEELKRLNARS